MSVAEQFDFFEDETITALKADILALKTSQEKVRRNLFAKHGDVVKMLLELLERIEQLEGKKDNYETNTCNTEQQETINLDG